jgi:hypothetical protein
MFRTLKDKNGQSSSSAQMREGHMLSNSMLWGEMALEAFGKCPGRGAGRIVAGSFVVDGDDAAVHGDDV